MKGSEDSQKPGGDDALEARIVAWVLGEASPFESAELEKLCAEDPKLREFERRMRGLNEILVADAKPGMDAAWKLPAGKREKVTDLLGVMAEAPADGKVNRYFARRILLAAAACVAISLVSYPLFNGAGVKMKVAVAPEKAVDFMPSSGGGGSTATREALEMEPMSSRSKLARTEELVAGKRGEDSKLMEKQDRISGRRSQGAPTRLPASDAEVGLAMNEPMAPATQPPPAAMMPEKPAVEMAGLAKQEVVDEAGKKAGAESKPLDPADVYYRGWLESREGERLKEQGDEVAAKAKLAKARQNFERVQQEYPGWKRDMVEGRLAQTEDQLSQLGVKAAEGKDLAEHEGAARANADFIGIVDGASIPGVPGATGTNVTDIVTGGLRSGDGAINRNNIDAVLNNPNRVAVPGQAVAGIDALTGTFSGGVSGAGPQAGQGVGMGRGDTSLLTDAAEGGLERDLSLNYFADRPANEPAFVPRAEDPLVHRFSRQEIVPRKPGEMPILDPGTRDGYVLDYRSSDLRQTATGGDPYALSAAEKFFFGSTGTAIPGGLGVTGETGKPETPKLLLGGEVNVADAKERGLVAPATPTEMAAEGGYSGAAQKEMIRRQQVVADADQLLKEGREAYANGKFKEAHDKYQESLLVLPDSPVVADRRKVVGEHLNDAAVALGDAYRRVGKYDEAAQLASDVLATDPQNADAKKLKEWLGDPIQTNPALTYEHTETVDKVRRSLYLAEGAYNLGKYDDAARAYEDVIRVDPSNQAARRGMEQVALAKTDYYRAAYDHTRAELLSQVDKAWETSVPPAAATHPAGEAKAGDGLSDLAQKEVARRQSTVAEADRFVEEGRKARESGDLEKAYKMHVDGLGMLPEASGVDTRRSEVKKLLGEIATGLAVDAKAKGNKDVAKEWAGRALQWNPEQKDAKGILDLGGGDETSAAAEPFSTFSLHVSDASFKLAKAALDRGEQPDPAGIRAEEFYNAFDYGDPAPAQGEPVVCVTEQAAHPILPQRNLVRIGVRTAAAGRGGSTPLNLMLLLDSSGSMEREDRQAAMMRAVEQLSKLLKEDDTITVAGFARQPRLLADRLSGARAQELNRIIAQTPSEGGTNLEEGLKLAEELAKRQFNGAAQNRIVLFTDGAANLGDAEPESLQARVEQLRQQGIAFDAAGFGADGLNDRLLERLTRNGNGRYYVVDRAEDAGEGFAKQLAGAFRPAAENVKVQVRFNPARVARYKLIGFEEHRLAKEDFKNDAVDAAEMAAEEAGNALYQIQPIPGGEGEIGEVSVRFRDVASGQMVERTWTIPYEAQVPAFDQAAPSMQLAGLAMFAAEKLGKGPMAAAIDLGQLGKVFGGVKARYAGSGAVEELGGMIEMLK